MPLAVSLTVSALKSDLGPEVKARLKKTKILGRQILITEIGASTDSQQRIGTTLSAGKMRLYVSLHRYP